MRKLEEYVVKGGERMRMGYTTGTCAASAAAAAAGVLLGGAIPDAVIVHTPKGIDVEVEIESVLRVECVVVAAVRKDGGDDPDATDGMMISARVERIPEGIVIDGGEGVGRVTRPGLPCAVGEAAINPVPREMIASALRERCASAGYTGGLRAVIEAPGGEEIAQNTFNPRLGIVGGISILGTSGIVEPMSEAAMVATVRIEIDQRCANGQEVLVLTPGNYGRDFAREQYGIALDDAVKCSNYIGEALDYAVYKQVEGIVLLGHAGKLVKLAAGVMNTHSAVADARMEVLGCHCALCGGTREQVAQVLDCVTVDAADGLLRNWGLADAVWRSVAGRTERYLSLRAKGVPTAFAAYCAGGVVMRSNSLDKLLAEMKRK